MSNRETYPASQSPLQGDIDGSAGATLVTVVGFQHVPASPTPPLDHQKWVYHEDLNQWVPTSDANESISFNGLTVSDDYDIGFNLPLGTTDSPVLFNGA